MGVVSQVEETIGAGFSAFELGIAGFGQQVPGPDNEFKECALLSLEEG